MGRSVEKTIDVLIQVDPIAYYNYEYAKKPEVFKEICPDRTHLAKLIKVYDLSGHGIKLWVDAPGNHAMCGKKG